MEVTTSVKHHLNACAELKARRPFKCSGGPEGILWQHLLKSHRTIVQFPFATVSGQMYLTGSSWNLAVGFPLVIRFPHVQR